MQRQINLLFSLFLAVSTLSAVPIDSLTALSRARCWLEKEISAAEIKITSAEKKSFAAEVSPLKEAAALSAAGSRPVYTKGRAEGHPVAYIYYGAKGHFLLTPADDRLPAVLGYGVLAGEALPPALQGWLDALPLAATASEPAPAAETPVVKPLLPFTRNQDDPYNRYCPHWTDDEGVTSDLRCKVGCVATALEEIISYYRREVCLKDTLHGWTTDHYAIADVLPGTTVDCRLIRDTYDGTTEPDEAIDAVARLSYYCGVAARMNYGLSESGARVRTLVEPLRRAFGYGYVHYTDSYQYAPEAWRQMLVGEIAAGRPVLYAGYTQNIAGHAFVLDGLDGNGLFHVNWGYGGAYDGYFRLDWLNASAPPTDQSAEGKAEGFFCNQEALLLCPDEADTQLPDTLSRTGEELTVDALRFERPPVAGIYTPLRLVVTNRADYAVTTPFELFTNAPTDTLLFEQGDYIALTGTTLRPGETAEVRIHATFRKPGERVLRISPDDIHIAYEEAVTIAPEAHGAPQFAEPEFSYPAEGCVRIRQEVYNASPKNRCGYGLYFYLFDGEAGAWYEALSGQTRFLYAHPLTQQADTIEFQGLEPGHTYTLQLKWRWHEALQRTFTLPEAADIDLPAAEDLETQWFSIDGRRLHRPQGRGIYLRRRGEKVEKIYHSQ